MLQHNSGGRIHNSLQGWGTLSIVLSSPVGMAGISCPRFGGKPRNSPIGCDAAGFSPEDAVRKSARQTCDSAAKLGSRIAKWKPCQTIKNPDIPLCTRSGRRLNAASKMIIRELPSVFVLSPVLFQIYLRDCQALRQPSLTYACARTIYINPRLEPSILSTRMPADLCETFAHDASARVWSPVETMSQARDDHRLVPCHTMCLQGYKVGFFHPSKIYSRIYA